MSKPICIHCQSPLFQLPETGDKYFHKNATLVEGQLGGHDAETAEQYFKRTGKTHVTFEMGNREPGKERVLIEESVAEPAPEGLSLAQLFDAFEASHQVLAYALEQKLKAVGQIHPEADLQLMVLPREVTTIRAGVTNRPQARYNGAPLYQIAFDAGIPLSSESLTQDQLLHLAEPEPTSRMSLSDLLDECRPRRIPPWATQNGQAYARWLASGGPDHDPEPTR